MEKDRKNITSVDSGCKESSITTISMINCPTILTGMSHEVRTQMNAIVAFSYLMNRTSGNGPEREEFGNQILASCEQLIGLIDNFLDSAIIESGSQKADCKTCRLDILFAELLAEFRDVLNRETNQEVVLVSESSPSGSDELCIDADRIFRVIRILFQNARKNTKSGYIRIGYYFRDGNVTFYVVDSGQGYFTCKEFLHSEDLDGSLAKYNDTVTAVNITLAKKLIQILGGTVWIECNGLTGTGIYFSIPERQTGNPDLNINRYVSSVTSI